MNGSREKWWTHIATLAGCGDATLLAAGCSQGTQFFCWGPGWVGQRSAWVCWL